MCLGRHRLQRVAENADPEIVADHSQRHSLDKYYNFFERSSWTPTGLAYRVAVLILTHMPLSKEPRKNNLSKVLLLIIAVSITFRACMTQLRSNGFNRNTAILIR